MPPSLVGSYSPTHPHKRIDRPHARQRVSDRHHRAFCQMPLPAFFWTSGPGRRHLEPVHLGHFGPHRRQALRQTSKTWEAEDLTLVDVDRIRGELVKWHLVFLWRIMALRREPVWANCGCADPLYTIYTKRLLSSKRPPFLHSPWPSCLPIVVFLLIRLA